MANYPDDADGAVLTNLAAAGVDLSKPILIEFPVAAPDEESAEAIAAALRKARYEGKVEYDGPDLEEDDDPLEEAWTVYVNLQMVPTYDEILRIQADLDRLAQPFGGNSDGWGVMLEPDGTPRSDQG